jgi:hypothetical protein
MIPASPTPVYLFHDSAVGNHAVDVVMHGSESFSDRTLDISSVIKFPE